MAAPTPRPDYWTRWFFRLVQLVGLALFILEARGAGRPYVLLFCMALILGAAGVRFTLSGLSELAQKATEADTEHPRERR